MFKFKDRKVLKQGNARLMCLPTVWIRSFETPFNKISITMNDDKSLLISPIYEGEGDSPVAKG